MHDSRMDPRFEPWPDARPGERVDPHPDPLQYARSAEHVQHEQMPDRQMRDGQMPDGYAQPPRSQPVRIPELRIQEARLTEDRISPETRPAGLPVPTTRAAESATETRAYDPRLRQDYLPTSGRTTSIDDPQRRGVQPVAPSSASLNDSRLNELGQRLQAFGTPAQRQPNAGSASPYHGAPLPVGPSTANYPAGEFDGPIDAVPTGPPYDGPYPPRTFPRPVGAEPSADTPLQASEKPVADAARSAEGSSTGAGSPDRPQLSASVGEDGSALKGGFQRVVHAVRAALPLVQKLLPLLDGNLVTTVSALLAPQPVAHQPAPQIHVDLEPVERGISELRTSHRELRTQVAEQGTTLKRVEDQLERVREATDRNTLEQQELMEDVRAVGARMSRLVVLGVILLALSVGLNVYLLVQLQHIFR